MFGGAAVAAWMTVLFLSLAVWEWLSSSLESRGWAAVVVMAVWEIVAAVLTMIGPCTTRQIQGDNERPRRDPRGHRAHP
ncbi:hypothetical protein GCM10023258_33180 [Terrabacter aeriphilus]|uniref:Uncharacterized protein n=2 Tax=Terrabacter aeriphilus TaxID=515662 RepID=A0ABP9JJS5_9MICO